MEAKRESTLDTGKEARRGRFRGVRFREVRPAREEFAKFFGTPQFLIGQSAFVVCWIAVNAAAVTYHWDPYPFVLLNPMFSLQAAYAAPLILLAQTRQAERDKVLYEADSMHREAISDLTAKNQEEVLDLAERLAGAVDLNTTLLQELAGTTSEIRQRI